MTDRSRGATRWMRELFHRDSGEPPRFAEWDEPRICSGLAGLLLAERRIGDAVCHAFDSRETAVEGDFARSDDGATALAAAYGMALTGRRVAAVIPVADIGSIVERLGRIVERHVPLVLHAVVGDSADIAAIAATGAPVAVARDAAHALDLALIARRVAESSLTPVVVAHESEVVRGVQDLRLPPRGLIEEYLGAPADTILAPTAAQQMLFGEQRRRVPRWFDLERPTAHGQSVPASEEAAAAEGRRTFFGATLAPALSEALEAYTAMTAREAGVLTRHGSSDQRHVLVTQGVAVPLARTVAEHLRRAERARIGVVGVCWHGPFLPEKLASSLSRAETVTVLERGTTRHAPLFHEVRAAAPGEQPRLIAAAYERLGAGQLREVCRNMLAKDPRPVIHAGVRSPEVESGFPKRQALLHRLRRSYPELHGVAVPDGEPLDVRPAGTKTVTVCLGTSRFPEVAARSMIETLARKLGAHVRGGSRRIDDGMRVWRLSFHTEPFVDPGGDVVSDLLLLDGLRACASIDLSADIVRGGWVVVASELDPRELSAALPARWREAIVDLDLDVRRVAASAEIDQTMERMTAAVAAWTDDTAADGVERVEAPGRSDTEPSVSEETLPLAVRRFGEAGETFDNVARFWGELIQPREDEPSTTRVPDPYVASGSVPACTSTLQDRTAGRERIPSIDAEKCTACGRCWTACPDSAIAPVAVGTERLLDAAADLARVSGEAAATLRRAHKQLAARIDGKLARSEGGRLEGPVVRDAFEWLAGKMSVAEDERPALEQAFERTFERLQQLPLSVTHPFFREPHAEKKGSGELLLLAVNPQSCQGCGICAAVCPDDAIRHQPQTPQDVRRMHELWDVWEALPDTSGATVARAAKHPGVGPLAAVLLSRHCTLSVSGGDGAEPGSGERVAVRQIAAVVEYQMQRRLLVHLERLKDLESRLRAAIRDALAESLAVDDLAHLEDALSTVDSERAAAAELLTRLDQLGESTDVDAVRTRRLVELAREVERARRSLVEGARGVGRARYGIVLAGGVGADWADRFPHNPFSVPVAVDLAADGAAVAAGLLDSLLTERVEEARLLRRAELWLEAPDDLPAREREIELLDRASLSAEERDLCPPILVLLEGGGLTRSTQAGLSRLLAGDYPAKVILFDGCDLGADLADPALLALSHRDAFVLSASLAHPDHLFEGVTAALSYSGPALIHVHAPSPRRHGFPSEATIDRAKLAVDSRVHPLLRYDPSADGEFGLRLDLQGNPAIDRMWLVDEKGRPWTPQRWAEGERRFHQDSTLLPDARGSTQPTVPGPNGRGLAPGEIFIAADDHRRQIWATLQELSGIATPFTEAVRRGVEDEVREAREAELAALRADYEARLEALDREQLTGQADRLRQRLLQLAGYGEGSAS